MFFHLYGMSMNAAGRFETGAAFDTGNQIEREMRAAAIGAGD